LQHTNNPVDTKIMGVAGRGKVLRAVSSGLGMVEEIVPPDEVLAQMDSQIRAESAQPVPTQVDAANAQGSQKGGEETGGAQETGPRVNLQQQTPDPPQTQQ
jgi:hypothetical protein